jgi:phosphoserine phosphatase
MSHLALFGEEKARRVCARYDLKQYPLIYGYGDTKEDFALLRLAHKKVFCGKEVAQVGADG